jgi:hypothetical protein
VKGLGLLLQAAVGTAESMRVGVEKAGVPKAFEDVGRQLEGVATAALRGLEQLVRAAGPAASASRTSEPSPADSASGPAAGASSADDDGTSAGQVAPPDESAGRSPGI